MISKHKKNNKIFTENVESSSLDRYFSFQGNPKDINFLDELLDYKKDILLRSAHEME